MAIFDDFKKKLTEFRDKIEEFKSNHEMASQAISAIVSSLPTPFDKFGGIIWDGLKAKESGPNEMLVILEKIEKNNESNFGIITSNISTLLEKNASKDDINKIAQQIQSSNDSVVKILASKLDEINRNVLDTKNNTEKSLQKEDELLQKVEEMNIKMSQASGLKTKNIVGKIIAIKNQPKWFVEEIVDANSDSKVSESQVVTAYMEKWYTDTQIKVDLGANSGIKEEDLFIVVYSDVSIQELENLNIGNVDETMLEITAKNVQPDYCICMITSLAYNKLEEREKIIIKKLGLENLEQNASINVEMAEKIKSWAIEGELAVLVPREQKLAHDELEDLYNQTLSDKVSNEKKKFYYEEMERKNRKYLLSYPHTYFAPNALFQQGYAQFQLDKFNESIETFNLFLEQYPFHVSSEGARKWIMEAEEKLKNT